jgi:hypothetical protein
MSPAFRPTSVAMARMSLRESRPLVNRISFMSTVSSDTWIPRSRDFSANNKMLNDSAYRTLAGSSAELAPNSINCSSLV